MTTSKKLKADDYLQELANQSGEEWLKSLIGRVLLSRAIPDEAFLDEIYKQFLIVHKLQEKKAGEAEPAAPIVPAQRTAATNGFALKSLQHESGVNALERGATIPFHPKLTVVYGKNGSGKSGFVRILKRVAGSRTQEDVWQNVHSTKSQNRCKAKIQYANGATDTVCQWSGESRLAPFDQMAVFDGKCIPIYLNKSLGFSYQPYGFELFQALSTSMQGLQERLAEDIRNTANDKPLIDDIFNEETSIGKFVAGITASTKSDDLNKLPAWDAKAQKALTDKTKERKGLQNLDQQSEILRTRNQKLKALEDALAQVQSDLSAQNIRVYFGLVKKFAQLKKKQAVKKGKTLEDYDIAEKESDEWEKFIDAGEDYIRIAEHDEYPGDDDRCIYCQQKLSKGAQKLIQLYRELFQEEETSDIEDVEEKLNGALNDLENSSFADDFPYGQEDFEKFLQKRTVATAFAALTEADSLAQKVASSLKNKKPQKFQPVKTSGIISSIRKARAKVEADIKTLEESQRNLFKKSQALDKEIAELQDIQKFSKHRPQVEKYIAIERWIEKASPLQANKLNTKPTTDLGKKAWRELVSDSFKAQFQKEAADLDAPGVNLEFRGEYGSQMRAKNMEGLDGIDQFLSEGEQKAVALSDFFAELSMQTEHAPVIFDDPATSFDHDRKERIAKRIVQESEARQIVVFTHDLMFASYLHDQVENNDGNIDPAKAAFHDLHSEAARVGVVTQNYYPGSVKFDAYIQKVEAKVLELETLTGEAQADGIRGTYGMLRRAVEKAVEERIFGRVITRWSDQIQMHNATRASLSREKLDKAKQLHEEFSRYIEAHNQSDEMVQHAAPDIAKLKTDIQQIKDIAVRQA
ncbi:MAG: AAA family ATPase [Patescibacteria group bacterium]|nr:AAA family ATPase [Patescibacteria group bacterium]